MEDFIMKNLINLVMCVFMMIFKQYPRFSGYNTDSIRTYTELSIKTNLISKSVYLLNNILNYDYMKINSSNLSNIARDISKYGEKHIKGYIRVEFSRDYLISFRYMRRLTLFDVYKANKRNNKTPQDKLVFFIKINSKDYKRFVEYLRKFSIYTWKDEHDYNKTCMKDFGVNFYEDSIFISSNNESIRLSTNEFIDIMKPIKENGQSFYALFINLKNKYIFSPVYHTDDINDYIKASKKCIIFDQDTFKSNIQVLYNILNYTEAAAQPA